MNNSSFILLLFYSSTDLSDFKAIRSRVPEDISNFLLRLAVYRLQRDAHQDISWIEPRVRLTTRISSK